jgi:hypothetical protein
MPLKTNARRIFSKFLTRQWIACGFFVPNLLLPSPPLELNSGHFDRSERANRTLGKLDGLSRFCPTFHFSFTGSREKKP